MSQSACSKDAGRQAGAACHPSARPQQREVWRPIGGDGVRHPTGNDGWSLSALGWQQQASNWRSASLRLSLEIETDERAIRVASVAGD